MLQASLAAAPWSPPWPLPRRQLAVAAAAVIAACVLATGRLGYAPHDADTRLYIALAADMAASPVVSWCAPVWGGHWSRQGLFLEHPPGMFWAGAALIRLGLTPTAALLALNAAAWLGSLVLLFRLAYFLGGRPLAVLATGAYVASPAFFQYLVRGNQENPLACAVLAALAAPILLRGTLARAAGFAAGFTAALAIKGLAGLAVLPVAVAFAACHQRDRRTAMALALGTAVTGAAVRLFDAWVYGQTGASFVRAYFAGQIAHSVGGGGLGQKLENLLYYLGRPLWFALPSVVLALVALVARGRARLRWCPALTLAVVLAATFIGGFSLADRKAERYLFPMYPGLALGAAALALQTSAGPLRRLQAVLRRPRPALPYATLALLLLGMAAKVGLSLCCYRFVRLWPGA